ncbi:MAG TPA: hypothetical protein VKA43_02195 [Gammaproteobacteria bacterium]|nr:hypothetical protein [Gammaproteobacteria bacterium]
MLRTLNTGLLTASVVALAGCFFNRNAIPSAIDFHPRLSDEPRQREIEKAPLRVAYAGVDYRVEPLYDYELYGLVVSFRQHDGESSMHRWSNDHLNMADVCVVWSDTAFSRYLGKLDFWNGIFTCNVQTRDSVAWASFKMNQLANNHLISEDPYIRERAAEIRVGDQIRIKGWLARYGAAGGGLRGTSTTREDTGDGACETIYVREFEIVRRGFSPWRLGMYAALAVLVATIAIHFALPYRPYRD